MKELTWEKEVAFPTFCPFASPTGYEFTEFWHTIAISSDVATSIYIISCTAVVDDRLRPPILGLFLACELLGADLEISKIKDVQ